MSDGGASHLNNNIQYLAKEYDNFHVLLGLGNEEDIPAELKNKVTICKASNRMRKRSKILSFLIFSIWSLLISIKKSSVMITIGWNQVPFGLIYKIISRKKWVSFLDNPLLNNVKGVTHNSMGIQLIFLKIALNLSRFADASVIINKNEKESMWKLFNIPMERIFIIPPVYSITVPDDGLTWLSEGISIDIHDRKILVFYGDFTYEENMAAGKIIIDKIAPIVTKEYPNSLFVLFGKHSDVFLGSQSQNIYVLGFLEENEMLSLIKHSFLTLAPIAEEHRGGVKTKVMLSITVGTPVLSTPAGVDGLEEKNIPAFISTIENFASELIHLLQNTNIVSKKKSMCEGYISKYYSYRAYEVWKNILR